MAGVSGEINYTMAKELIVSVNGREKKIAIIENEKVTEFYIERGEGNQGIVGNIYKGRVMRVLPGMQSAFVDVGLERDAFLYVSDFFDEEEEFERIVIDKSQKGNVEEAERVAAEQIALARVERERHIEATHELVEPFREMEQEDAPAIEAEHSAEQPEEADSAEASKRRSRRGRRRRGGRDGADANEDASTPSRTRIKAEDIDTPFVAADPSILRIVDEEETAANGEMFKDARLQERLFDQIHAGEFNLEDDFRTAEVGSVISSVDYRDGSFQRVDDGDNADSVAAPRTREQIAARIGSFVDDIDDNRLQSGSFERVSDDEAETSIDAEETLLEKQPRERANPKKSRVGKLLSSLGAKKKATSKRSTKKPGKELVDNGSEPAEAADNATTQSIYADAEASLEENDSRAEFATRRGGRRRRRPSKASAADAAVSDTAGEDASADDNPEQEAVAEEMTAPEEIPETVAPPATSVTPAAQPRDSRDTRGGRDSRDRGRDGRGQGQRGSRGRDRQQQPTITDLLREGQEILVQIAKEPIAKKGARITSHIALPGRFLVYMPTVEHVGVSRKIESDSERQRLRKLITLIRGSEDIPSGGFIVRTAGVGISEAELREDVRYLVRTWLDIRARLRNPNPRPWFIKTLIWCSAFFAISYQTTLPQSASIQKRNTKLSLNSLTASSRVW